MRGTLRDCCEAEGERVLETDGIAVVAAEREFNPISVIVRTMHAADLVFILTLFVEPPWPFDDRLACRAQFRLSVELAGFQVDQGARRGEDVPRPRARASSSGRGSTPRRARATCTVHGSTSIGAPASIARQTRSTT